MHGFIFEWRQAWRSLARSPGHALLCIGMLGSGLGLTMYMFGAINAFLLRPLPFPGGERLAHVELSDAASGRGSVEMPLQEFVELAATQKSLSPFAFYSTGTVNLSGDDRPERYEGGFFSPDTFETVGVPPLMGRTLQRADYVPGAPAVLLISHTLWQQRYMGDPGILNRVVRMNGKPATIVGVMPAEYRFPLRQDVWIPVDMDLSKVARGESMTGEVIGRMVPGADFGSTAREFDTLLAAIAQAHPDTASKGMRAVVKSLNAEYAGLNTPRILWIMMCAVIFVLAIACVNVANLMLVRTAERSRELAIHAALGAERTRLMARLLREGALVCAIGGGIGLLIAQWFGQITMQVLIDRDNGLPFWMQYRLDLPSIVFAFGVALVAALAATLVPALRAGRASPALVMREGGGAGKGIALGRLSRVLVAAEITLCAVLLVLAGLTVRSIDKMQHVEVGAEVAQVMSGRVALFAEQYPGNERVQALQAALLERLQALPGVQSAALTTSVPLTFSNGTSYLEVGAPPPAEGKRAPFAYLVSTTPSFFDTFRVPIVRGRLYGASDDARAPPVALVNQALADRLWPGADPLGKRLDLDPKSSEDVPVEIIGVVPTVLHDEPDSRYKDTLYVPLAQRTERYVSLAIRVPDDPAAHGEAIRQAVRSVDGDLPVYFLRTVQQWIEIATMADRLMSKLFSTFALFGLVLAGAGIYALLAYGVAARTREIGVRRALGAPDKGIVRMVMRQGALQLVFGIGIGLVLAVLFARLLSNVLFGVAPFDPVTFCAVAVTLAVVVLLASWLPARRALGVEPMQALRYE